MRRLLFLCFLFLTCNLFAQLPPVLQWQKNFGGSLYEDPFDIKILPDGSSIIVGYSTSSDGDVSVHHGSQYKTDIWVIKLDINGNIVWQKSFGGDGDESPVTLIQTTDGGYLIAGWASSNDGDVSGNHGTVYSRDAWIIKLDAVGTLVWQKCYGGSDDDEANDIIEVGNGFIVAGTTKSRNGDVTGLHGSKSDLWIFKIDLSGNLIWQKCYGGTESEGAGWPGYGNHIRQAPDGNFIVTTSTHSIDGDITNPIPRNGAVSDDIWILKITGTGGIIWNKCVGGNFGEISGPFTINNDGSIVIAGLSYSDDLPGTNNTNIINVGNAGDGFIFKLDAAGNLMWIKALGGKERDEILSVISTPDGGYLLTGSTASDDIIVCKKHVMDELWLVKLDATGNIQWNRALGGNKNDQGRRAALTASGDCMVISSSYSTDGDITNNKGYSDFWVTRFSFTGTLITPSITIVSGTEENFCTGKEIQFIASPVQGGTKPSYQWQLNGVNVAFDNDTVVIPNIYNNSIVNCILTSNSNCVDFHKAVSNNEVIPVIPPPLPKSFLPADTALCFNEKIFIKTDSAYISYKWSNGSTAPNITLKKPGLYWLQVTDNKKCIGRDSIRIIDKNCMKGIYIPNAFSPNEDGENDYFTPLFFQLIVKKYRFIVYDRWGKIVFETTTVNKGWDGNSKGQPATPGVFVWQCQYQLEGEPVTNKKGSVLLLR